jgi:hypothetical protein
MKVLKLSLCYFKLYLDYKNIHFVRDYEGRGSFVSTLINLLTVKTSRQIVMLDTCITYIYTILCYLFIGQHIKVTSLVPIDNIAIGIQLDGREKHFIFCSLYICTNFFY